MEAMLKQSEQMTTLMTKIPSAPKGSGGTNPGMQLTKEEKCPKCQQKKNAGRARE